MKEETISDIARNAVKQFEGASRESDGKQFTRTKEGCPEWVSEMIRNAHGDMLPDDWKYDAIESILCGIADSDDPEESRQEIIDGVVDVYNHDLSAWVASNINRGFYVDEAVEELGYPGDFHKALGYGQYWELEEIFGFVLSSLESRLGDIS